MSRVDWIHLGSDVPAGYEDEITHWTPVPGSPGDVGGWIAVSDRLPCPGEIVDVWHKDRGRLEDCQIRNVRGGTRRYWIRDDFGIPIVESADDGSHWRPIPPPPNLTEAVKPSGGSHASKK
jgi:hypothetical protein